MAQEPNEAQKLAMELDRDQALRDLQGAVGWLAAEGAARIGATGFCMGGGLVWQLACADERLAAAVPFYGTAELEGRRILAPVIAHYGSADRFEPELLEEIRRRIKSSRAGNELFVYEGAPHAFMNEARPSYRPGAAELAWGRTLTFLRSKLSQD